MWSVVVHEELADGGRRRKRTYYETADDTYHHLAIPTEYVESSFDVRMKQMLGDHQGQLWEPGGQRGYR